MPRDYYEIVKDILESEEFQKRKKFAHHGSISVYDHSLRVSMVAYELSKKFKKSIDNSVKNYIIIKPVQEQASLLSPVSEGQ